MTDLRGRREEGQALVEFALVLPLLLLLLFGIIQVGFVLHARQTVAYAARVAADTYAREHSEREATAEARTAGAALRPSLRPPHASISYALVGQREERVCTRRGWFGRGCRSWANVVRRHERRPSQQDRGTPGELVKAVVTYSYPVPIRGTFGPLHFPGTVTLTGEAFALIETARPAEDPQRPGRRVGQNREDADRD